MTQTSADTSEHSEYEGRTINRSVNALALLVLVFLGLLLRLYHVSAPPYDFLSWRDTQTLMVARHFYEDDMNIFTPEVDWRLSTERLTSGVVGRTELMITPWLTALLYRVFGEAFWAGRIVPIGFSLLAGALFCLLAKRYYCPSCAMISALILTVSPYFLYAGAAKYRKHSHSRCLLQHCSITRSGWPTDDGLPSDWDP